MNRDSMLFAMHVPELVLVVECIRTLAATCNSGQYVLTLPRANTMSSALEVLGMSLPYSSSIPAMYPG
jgi:dihydroxyacid dehydratase/phosphogluconate dehydratase